MNNKHISKRRQKIIRALNYALMTVAVVTLSIICIFLILGYQFDTKKGTIDQGGLIQFRSFPTSAKITLDGLALNFRTPGKLNVSAGKHSVLMEKAGYHDWSKSFMVKPGELRWLNYARFIPEKLTSSTVATLTGASGVLPSPDRQWLAVITEADKPVITMFDLRDDQDIVSTKLTLPETVLARKAVDGEQQTYSLAEWDFGARFLLIKRTVGATTEFIRIERSETKSATNITEQYNLAFSEMHFSGTSGNAFYSLNDGDLRYVDVSAKTVSQPLIQKVTQFELYKQKDIAYVMLDGDVQKVGVMRDQDNTIVRTYPVDTPVSIDLSSFSNNDYLALTHGTKLEILKDPLDNADTAGRVYASKQLSLPSVGWLMFSNNGRFVVAGNGVKFETYDIETDEEFAAGFEGETAPTTQLKWLDDYYLVSTATGTLSIAEFDGKNTHTLVPSVPGLSVTVSDTGDYLYSVAKNDTGYVLQATKLNLEAN